MLFHHTHGFLKVKELEQTEEQKTTCAKCIGCTNGKKNDSQYEIREEDMKDLSSHIQVQAKIYLANNEIITQDLQFPVNKDIIFEDALQAIVMATQLRFNVYANGDLINLKSKVYKVITQGSKLLMYPIGPAGAGKPEGIRHWCRFPKHNLTEEYYVSTSD